jgi:hypothetical protein
VGHAFILVGLVLLLFLQVAGFGLILVGLMFYVACAFYFFVAPRCR